VLNEDPCDFLLLRYCEEGGAHRAAAVSQVPIINAIEVYETRHLRRIAADLDVIYRTRAHTPCLEHALRFECDPGFYAVDRQVLAELPVTGGFRTRFHVVRSCR
jgi:hypothetical protein